MQEIQEIIGIVGETKLRDKRQRYMDLSGMKFGRLTAIEYLYTDEKRSAIWRCRCDCGNEKNVSSTSLKRGTCLSCGCLHDEKNKESKNRKHGESNSRLYIMWRNMKSRCFNTNSDDYKRYGLRGIKVCDEWLHNFDSFKSWAVKNGYNDNLTIDRINNNGDYCPNNCRFVDRIAQANNTRSSVFYEHCGEVHTIAEWSKIVNIPTNTLWNRINILHWDFEKAITTQIKHHKDNAI